LQLEGKLFNTVIKSTKSPTTKENYTCKLRGFVAFLGLKGNEVDKLTMNGDTRLIENTIIDFLIYLRDDREISSAAISNYVVALKYFYDTVNFEFPRLIDWRRIHKFIPEQEKIVKNDRPYTREEVAKMLSVSTEREAVVVLLQCAAGLRKGAIPALTLDDVKRYPEPNSLPKVYEIIVYRGTCRKVGSEMVLFKHDVKEIKGPLEDLLKAHVQAEHHREFE
jgi:Phage integrase, N-terminal SAM-like domain